MVVCWYGGMVGLVKGRFGNWRRFPDIARPRETAVATTPPSLHPRIARAYAASASARLASDRVSDSPPPPLRPTNEFMAPGLQFCTAQPLHFSETMPQATVSGKRATRERLLELWWYAGMLVWRYGGVGTRREWHQECRQRTRATPLRVDSMMYGCAFAIQRRSNVAIATTPPFLILAPPARTSPPPICPPRERVSPPPPLRSTRGAVESGLQFCTLPATQSCSDRATSPRSQNRPKMRRFSRSRHDLENREGRKLSHDRKIS